MSQCCWLRMLEMKRVGDKLEMLVTVLILKRYHQEDFNLSPIFKNCRQYWVVNIKLSPKSLYPSHFVWITYRLEPQPSRQSNLQPSCHQQFNIIFYDKKISNEFLKWIQIADILIFYSWSEIGGVSNSVQISNCFGLVTQMPN